MDKRRILNALSQLFDDDSLIDSGSHTGSDSNCGDGRQGERKSAGAVARTIAKIDGMLSILYPSGVKPGQYVDLVRTVRVLDRLCQLQELSESSAATSTAGSGADSLAKSVARGAEPAAPAPVDDDRTAPIINEHIFAQTIQSHQAVWKTLSEGTLRGRKRDGDGQTPDDYQSMFKLKPR